MKADLIAFTVFDGWPALGELGYSWDTANSADGLAEFAGRLCYEAYERKNPKTATNQGYIANILEHKHFSVLEHSSATFLIQDVSRALTHELVRHRHFSYSQVSQRYVNQEGRSTVRHPSMNDSEYLALEEAADMARQGYAFIQESMKNRGVDKKTRNGAARGALPEATSTNIIVTGNHRSWLEFIDKRYSKYADPEIQTLAGLILPKLKHIAPNIYQNEEFKDFGENPVQ